MASPRRTMRLPAQELLGGDRTRSTASPAAAPRRAGSAQLLATFDAGGPRQRPLRHRDAGHARQDRYRRGRARSRRCCAPMRVESATSRLGHRVGIAAQPHGSAARRRPADRRHSCWRSSRRRSWRRCDGSAALTRAAGDGTLRSRRRPGRATVPATRRSQVFSGGENVAMKGTATQSSTSPAAPPADNPRAPSTTGPTSIRKGTVPFTAPNRIRGGSSISASRGRSNRSPSGMPRPATTATPPCTSPCSTRPGGRSSPRSSHGPRARSSAP